MSLIGSVAGKPGLPTHERLDELLATANDPAPVKTVRVEWIGEPNPLDSPEVQYKMLTRQYTPVQIKAIRLAAARACTRTGNRRRVLEAGNDRRAIAPVPGLSRTYKWERGNAYLCDVTLGDADVILSSEAAHEFRLVES